MKLFFSFWNRIDGGGIDTNAARESWSVSPNSHNLSEREENVFCANSRCWLATKGYLWNLMLPKNFANMIFGLVFCPLSYTKRGDIGGGTRCIYMYRKDSHVSATDVSWKLLYLLFCLLSLSPFGLFVEESAVVRGYCPFGVSDRPQTEKECPQPHILNHVCQASQYRVFQISLKFCFNFHYTIINWWFTDWMTILLVKQQAEIGYIITRIICLLVLPFSLFL